MIDLDSVLLESFNEKYDTDDYELPLEYRFYRLRPDDRERLAEYLLAGLSYVQLQSVLLLRLVLVIWAIAQGRSRDAKTTEVLAI